MTSSVLKQIFDPKADLGAVVTSANTKLDETVVREIISENFSEAPSSIRELSSVNANDRKVFYAKVATGDYVLRINASSVKDNYLTVEKLIYGLPGLSSNQTLELLKTDIRSSNRNYDYQLFTKAGITNLEQWINMQAELPREVLQKLFLKLKNLHCIPVEGFGYFSPQTAKAEGKLLGLNNTWQQHILTNLTENIEFLERQNLINNELATKLQFVFNYFSKLLELDQAYLLHGDLHFGNVLVDYKREIAGLIDLSQARGGDPLFDVAYLSTYFADKYLENIYRIYDPESKFDFALTKLRLYRIRINIAKAVLRFKLGNYSRIPVALSSIKSDLKAL